MVNQSCVKCHENLFDLLSYETDIVDCPKCHAKYEVDYYEDIDEDGDEHCYWEVNLLNE
jgi:hypothetical protein